MQSVGEILRKNREEQGYSLREVSIQTTIGTKYLGALEENNFDVFPSETHITGFIRNYSHFLELNPDEMIALYRRIQLQEAPTPLEELTAPNRPRINPSFFLGLAAFVALGAVLMILIRSGEEPNYDFRADQSASAISSATSASAESSSVQSAASNTAAVPASSSSAAVSDGTALTFTAGQQYRFTVDGINFQFTVEQISGDTAVINIMGTRYRLKSGDEQAWDFTGDSFSNLRLKVLSINNGSMSAVVPPQPVLISSSSASSVTATAAPSDQTVAVKGKALLKSDERVQIHLEITSGGLSQLNVVRDNNLRSAHLLRKGNSLTFTAENAIQITATQPGNLSLNLNNVRLQIKTRNPVAGFLFKWRRNPGDGKYHLEYERVR